MRKPYNAPKFMSPALQKTNFLASKKDQSNDEFFNPLDQQSESKETYMSLLRANGKQSMRGQSLDYEVGKYEDSLFEGYDEELHQTMMRNRKSQLDL